MRFFYRNGSVGLGEINEEAEEAEAEALEEETGVVDDGTTVVEAEGASAIAVAAEEVWNAFLDWASGKLSEAAKAEAERMALECGKEVAAELFSGNELLEKPYDAERDAWIHSAYLLVHGITAPGWFMAWVNEPKGGIIFKDYWRSKATLMGAVRERPPSAEDRAAAAAAEVPPAILPIIRPLVAAGGDRFFVARPDFARRGPDRWDVSVTPGGGVAAKPPPAPAPASRTGLYIGAGALALALGAAAFKSMGRKSPVVSGAQEFGQPELVGKVSLSRVALDRGGYDRGGRYWGRGGRLWVAEDERGSQYHLRAADRAAAKSILSAKGHKVGRHS